MTSFDLNRFIDLTEKETKHLSCSICLNIFNNAIITSCGHTFCKSCLNTWIVWKRRKECPQCRKQFKKKKTNTAIDDNCVVISNTVFTRNLMANSMVDELTIKCSYDFNGCQQTVRFGSLPSHMKDCQYRTCKTCDLSFGNCEEHNCLELLKRERLRMKHKFIEMNEKIIELEKEVKKNVKQINRLKNKYIKSLKMIKNNQRREKSLKFFISSSNNCNNSNYNNIDKTIPTDFQ